MTLFTTRFKAPTTGNYQFKMDNKDDRHAMWIDLDQDGVFEGGSGTNGSAGNENLNPNGGTTPNVNEDWTSKIFLSLLGKNILGHWTLARRRRCCAFVHGSRFPVGSFVKMNNGSNQNGYYNLKGLSNGNFLNQQSLLEANGTNLVKGNTYYYRIKGVNSEGTDWQTRPQALFQRMPWTLPPVRSLSIQWPHPILVIQFRQGVPVRLSTGLTPTPVRTR